ncbi:DUF6447 family protein [Halochromatium salexigens]|uniref:Uncharacterized protein n=1 Tax=Halochromatium salexigens TaxID=49447 RepID=A0AAJ0XEG7_HALSE|nr:DUF6447 family protein [Halochromatium salexigens]MBK5929311.1 hypothetical protein [Halochromatium salexigens]
MAEENQTITIDGAHYELGTLSDEARSQIVNLRATDQEIEHLKRQLAICQTARAAYAKSLRDHLGDAQQATPH